MAGTIYWSPQPTNWFIVLDTWIRGPQQEWVDAGVTNWLMHQPGPLDGVTDPLASDVNFNVLTYDPTGHGADQANSQLPFSKLGPMWEQDAASTGGLNYLGASIDPAANYAMMNNLKFLTRTPCSIYVGASTGADRALQSCAANPAGCAGVVSMSPGGYLGTSYKNELKKYFTAWDTYKQAGDFSRLCPALDPAGTGASIHCLASKSDSEAANTCAPFSKDTVKVHLLDQSGHGLSYFFDKNGTVIDLVKQIIVNEVMKNNQ
jgi:pimeloyl-ACP methyl ester carboxylesterase